MAGLVKNVSGLIALRFFVGILGGTFVPCQVWSTGFFDKNIVELVLKITVILALISVLILAVTYLRELLLIGLLALGVLLISDNIGEIRRRLR